MPLSFFIGFILSVSLSLYFIFGYDERCLISASVQFLTPASFNAAIFKCVDLNKNLTIINGGIWTRCDSGEQLNEPSKLWLYLNQLLFYYFHSLQVIS